jgi:hypothetical protein
MKSLLRTLSIGLTFAAGIAPLCLNAQAVRGPVLGFVSDAAGTAVRPLIGVAGASGVGDRLALNVGVRRVHISPTQDYVLALLNESKAVALIDLTASGLSWRCRHHLYQPLGYCRRDLRRGDTQNTYHRRVARKARAGADVRRFVTFRTRDGGCRQR